MTTDLRTGRLPVPGADLYYDVSGEGPPLVLVPGGGGDAGVFDAMRPLLDEHHTVISYDPRCCSRSTEHDPATQDVAVHADDVRRLIEHTAEGPVRLFGTSAGAIVGLAAARDRPGLFKRTVLHEPPLFELLPDAESHRAMVDRTVELFHAEGPGPAMAHFGEANGPEESPEPVAPRLSGEAATRLAGNTEAFLARTLPSFTRYLPDLDSLPSTGITVGVGRNSRNQTAGRAAVELARRLGSDPVVFPGGHLGTVEHPERFARLLLDLLNGAPSRPS
ncbi:alpha/beta fold hydrolase [Salininema proteolyticum]|uniref:Alpha/beta fold hydrolase n=1 Tax=Salininema proteolyticum TaxID=1607685 RepID=A0ABV8U591_9ACTN